MFTQLVSFVGGLYCGVLAKQYYNIPAVDNPSAMYDKLVSLSNRFRKDKPDQDAVNFEKFNDKGNVSDKDKGKGH